MKANFGATNIVKDAITTLNGEVEDHSEGWVESWDGNTNAERKFVQDTCHNFEVASGGEDGLLADRDYQFEYTEDGRLTCRNTRKNQLYPLKRCRNAMKTR